MLKKLLLAVLLGISLGAAAQTNFRPGYVVTPGGDTLRGEVDARGAQRNARQVRFRPTPAAASIEYRPQQLRGYGLAAGRQYQTETIVLADSVAGESLLSARLDSLRQPVFLEIIVRGALSLFFLEDRQVATHYYLRGSDGQLRELTQTAERVVGTKSLYDSGIESQYQAGTLAAYDRQRNAFRYTLQAATRQCPAVQSAIVEVKFELRPLARLVERYNECVGDVPSVSPALRTPPARVVVLAGFGGSRLALTDDRFFLQVRSTATAGMQPIVGLGLELPLDKISEKLALQLQALYHAQRYQTAVVSDRVLGTMYQYRANIQSVRVPLLLRYTWPVGQIRPFAQAGYGVSYLLKNDSEVRWVPAQGQTPLPRPEWKPLMEGSRLEGGFLGSVGVTKRAANQRNVALELRLESTNGFAGTQGVSSGLTRYFLLLSYDLTK